MTTSESSNGCCTWMPPATSSVENTGNRLTQLLAGVPLVGDAGVGSSATGSETICIIPVYFFLLMLIVILVRWSRRWLLCHMKCLK